MTRIIKYTNQFKKDYKREQRGLYSKSIDADLLAIVEMLVSDQILPLRAHDHPLKGEWSDHRDCHIKPDLVLIYRKPDKHSLELVRLGSHSELSL